MASYLVLTSPGATRDDEKARFIADRFSWFAFVLPAIWLLSRRQWVAGAVIAALQVAVGLFSAEPRTMLAGLLVELAIRMLVALEGPAFVARRLEVKGWTLQAVIPADDLTTAEMIYDSDTARTVAHPDQDNWQPPAMPSITARAGDGRGAFGLFETYGER